MCEVEGDSWRIIQRGTGVGVACALPLLCGQTCRRKKAPVLGDFLMARLHGTPRRISDIVGSEHSSRYGHYSNSHVLPLGSELSVHHLHCLPGLSHPPW